MTTAAGSSCSANGGSSNANNRMMGPSSRPPCRPKKKRTHSDDDDDEQLQQEEEESRGLESFYVAEFPLARRRIPFAEQRQQQQHTSSSAPMNHHRDDSAAATTTTTTTLPKASLAPQLPPRTVSGRGRRNLWSIRNDDSTPTAAVRSSPRRVQAAACSRQTPQDFRPPPARRSTRRHNDDHFQALCQQAQALKTPAEQSVAYWNLVYGPDTPQPLAAVAVPALPIRSVLKRPNKRSRFQPQEDGNESLQETPREETSSSSSFDSPQAAGGTLGGGGSYCTPQPTMMDLLPSHTVTSRSDRVVQFGPSQAVSFVAGTPVEGGLEPLPGAAVQFPTDGDSSVDEEELANLEETKANAARLAEWDDMVDTSSDGDEDDDDDAFVLSTRRPARRSSTYFSPHPKSLLEELPDAGNDDDDNDGDAEDGDPPNNEQGGTMMNESEQANDPVEKLVLSALQVNSPTLHDDGDDSDKNKLERMVTFPSDDKVSEICHGEALVHDPPDLKESSDTLSGTSLWNENVSPDRSTRLRDRDRDEASTEKRKHYWEQLLSKPALDTAWIRHFETSPPLRKLFLDALDACHDDAKRGALVSRPIEHVPSLGLALAFELRFLDNFVRHFETLNEAAVRAEREKLDHALRLVYSVQPPTSRQIEIAKLESEIAVLEQAIVREQVALVLARQRKLRKELDWCHRQVAEWKLLSSLLADIDFPKEDDTSPTGLAYSFPIERLECELTLRPDEDGSLDSTSLDLISTDTASPLPLELVESLRRITLAKLSGMTDDENYDFQLAVRQTFIFLGRLDRILDDLEGACRMWEHDVMVSSDNGDAVTLEFQGRHETMYRLMWQILPSSGLVLEYAYPSRVELVKDGATTIMNPSACPPSLRVLWNEVATGALGEGA